MTDRFFYFYMAFILSALIGLMAYVALADFEKNDAAFGFTAAAISFCIFQLLDHRFGGNS